MKKQMTGNTHKFFAARICTWAGGLLILLLLGGCATQNAEMELVPDSADNRGNMAIADAMTASHEAVLLVTARPHGDEAARRLRLTWARLTAATKVHDIIEIKGVLGNTRARFEIFDADDAGGISLKIVGLRAGQESEARRVLALLPPPRSLGYWLLRKADPAYSALETLAVGKVGIARLVQHGWEVQYDKVDETGRPLRLILRAAAATPLAGMLAPGEEPPPPRTEVIIEITQWLSGA